MRVTNSMMVSQLLLNVNRNLVKMSDQQDQLATGKRIRRPSDDPVLASKIIRYKTDIAEMAQYETNTRDAIAWLDTTEVALKGLGEIIGRTRDLAVQAANGTNTTDETQKIASEIENLRDSLIQTGNTTFAGRYIFSSFETDKALFNDDGSYSIDIGKFAIDNKPVSEFEISIGERINVMTHGIDIFGTQFTDNIVTQKIVNTFDSVGEKGSIATKAQLISPINLNADMTKPPTNIVNITIGPDTYEMDVAGLDGTVTPIDKNVLLARMNGAVTNPGGLEISTVASIYMNVDDNIVIESKIAGPLVITENLNGVGTNGVSTEEAIFSDALTIITNADIAANAAALVANTFAIEVNGVSQNVMLPPATTFGVGTELADFVTELNLAIDTAFGSDVIDVTDVAGSLEYTTKGTINGVLPTVNVSSSTPFVFFAEGGNIGVQATKSKLVAPVDFTRDMTNPPTGIVNITIDGTVFEMDVSTLDGSSTPINKNDLLALMQNASTNPAGAILSDVVSISYDVNDKLVIEANNFGNINIEDSFLGYSIKGEGAVKMPFNSVDGVVSGIQSRGSFITGPVDLTADMTNPPSNLINIMIDGVNYEMNVEGLNGVNNSIEKKLFMERISSAISNPGNVEINEVANIYFNSNNDLMIESKVTGPIVMTEDLNGFGYNGVATLEASFMNMSTVITDADIAANAAALLANTFTFEVNGVSQNVVLPPATIFGVGSELTDFIAALNTEVDLAFGTDVIDIVDSGGYLTYSTKDTVDGTLPTLSIKSSTNFSFLAEGDAIGREATKSKMLTSVDFEANMTNKPTNISNIIFNGVTYEMDVSDLDGTLAPIDKSVFLSRLQNASTNPPGALLNSVANISYNSYGKIEIEAIDFGDITMDEEVMGFGSKGNNAVEARVGDPSKKLTSEEIVANGDILKNTILMLTVNGVSKKVKINSNTLLSGNTALEDYVAALNLEIDREFGSDVIDVINNSGSLEFVTKNTPEGITPSLSVDYTRTTESTLINDVNKFIEALNIGDQEGIDDYLAAIDGYSNKILSIRADVGARTNRLELVNNRIAENNISITRLLSDAQDADMSEVIMYLKNAENVYQASLSVGGRVIQPTLMDFLR